MNCPSRPDADAIPNGWNQNPNPLALEKNQDCNGIANLRARHDHRIPPDQLPDPDSLVIQRSNESSDTDLDAVVPPGGGVVVEKEKQQVYISERLDGRMRDLEAIGSRDSEFSGTAEMDSGGLRVIDSIKPSDTEQAHPTDGDPRLPRTRLQKCYSMLAKYTKFIGPGFMISVAYIDPGNYATDVAAGATFQYRLLVMVLVSNIIAIFLQYLCIRLGSVTGLNLAENIKAHCPKWLNYVLWFFAESAIIATDMAEVIGTAIALNLLINVPVVAGCAISIADVLIILIFYRPSGTMKAMRIFEFGVAALVLGVVICFSIELAYSHITNVGTLFRGYLPSSTLVKGQGLYQACGILGATVMPHSLYLGSGIVQPRLREYDEKHHNVPPPPADDEEKVVYRPSLAAIRSCMNYSILELSLSLATFALFVNSAILIVAGASLYGNQSAATADLFGIHDLLSTTLAPAAGTIFALALLLSGTSAGIICTIAGQMVSEGQLSLTMKPWLMRLMTRSISITPSIIVAGAVGKEGLSAALEGSQVALSVILPVTSAPLIYFTCRNKFMTVTNGTSPDGVKMKNGWIATTFAVLLWLLLVVMNVALLVLVGRGVSG